MTENIAFRIYDRLHDAQLNLGVCALMAASNAIDRAGMTVYANDPLSKQAELALPSALPTPVTTGNLAADIGIQVAETGLTIGIVSRTSSAAQLMGIGLTAQVLSCSADAGVERTNWLSAAEKVQPDVGFSAISTAWISKYLLNRADLAQTSVKATLWRTTMAVFAGRNLFSYFVLNETTGATLDMVSHGTGATVGIAAYALASRKKHS